MYLFQKIEEVSVSYQDARKVIALFLLEHQDNIASMSMLDIANATFTSKATLVRFAKMLEYQGWKDFIHAFLEARLYEEKYRHQIDPNLPFQATHTTREIMERIQALQIESLANTSDIMKSESLEQAVSLLQKANRIVIYTLYPHIFLAELFRWRMLSIGRDIIIAKTGESGMIAHSLNEHDCAIIISYSGNNHSVEPMKFIEPLKKRKTKIIGITSAGNNYIQQHSDCILAMSSREKLYSKISNFSSEESLNYILNLLFTCYFNQNYQKNLEFKINNSIALEEERHTILNELIETL